MTKHIACAVDFSPESESALEEAILVARRLEANIQLLHVATTTGESAGGNADELGARSLETLAALCDRFGNRGVVLEPVLLVGDPSTEICRAANERGCELVVLGSVGRFGLRRFLLGTVTTKVMRNWPSDILVSRAGPPRGGYRRILVPTDFSAAANRALARATELAEPNAEIDLFHVWQLPLATHRLRSVYRYNPRAFKDIAVTKRRAAEEMASPLLAEHQHRALRLGFVTGMGAPAVSIVDRSSGYDLVVIGRSGRPNLLGAALGSVAAKTVRHAPGSVLIISAPGG